MPRSNAREDGTAVERDLDRLDSVNKGLAAALNAQRGETPLAAAKSQPRRPRKKAQGGEAQGGTEDYCENASLAVVLAMEMPIIFVGGAVVYEVCFMDRDCTPSSSSIEAPVLELAQKQKQTTLF